MSMTAAAAASPAASPAAQLRDIVPPQPYHLPVNFLWVALIAAALALAGYCLWRWLRRPRKGPPPLSPRDLAAQRLEALRQRAPELEPRVFGAEVCGIISAYIGAVYSFHPERQTSAEFLEAMAAHRIFSPAQHAALGDFLTRCDLLKYARHEAAAEGKARLIEQAAEFLDRAAAGAPESALVGPTPLPAS